MRTDDPVLAFSLEMSRDQLARRAMASDSRVDSMRLLSGRLLDSEWPRLVASVNRLHGTKMHVDDTPGLTVAELRAKVVAHRQRHGLSLVVVDYLQLMTGGRHLQREREVAEMSRGLKLIAKEFDIPVIAVSQLSRSLEQRNDKRPVLSDLRDSGSIEQDADVVMFVYRDEYYNPKTEDPGIAEVIIRKPRMGMAPVTVKLRWFGAYTQFASLARRGEAAA